MKDAQSAEEPLGMKVVGGGEAWMLMQARRLQARASGREEKCNVWPAAE